MYILFPIYYELGLKTGGYYVKILVGSDGS